MDSSDAVPLRLFNFGQGNRAIRTPALKARVILRINWIWDSYTFFAPWRLCAKNSSLPRVAEGSRKDAKPLRESLNNRIDGERIRLSRAFSAGSRSATP